MPQLDVEERLVREQLRRQRSVKKRATTTLASQHRAITASRGYQNKKTKSNIVLVDRLKKK